MSKHLGFSSDPEALAAAIAAGHTAQVDAGTANGKLFLIVASCGLDADVVHQVHQRRRGNISRLSYALPLFRSINRYRYPKMRIQLDDRRPFSARWAFIFNVPRYALYLPIVNDASCLDGQLDLCAFRHGSLLNGLRYAGGIVLRLHRSWSDTVVTRFTSMSVESDEPVPFQLDGDPGGYLPLKVSVAPARLRIIVSENWVQSQRASQSSGV
jgi:diacylglycerol kinase family enzyme